MQSERSFSIKTEVFEGPLELLLDLIEKRKLLINDISLAAVTDEYMAHVAALEHNPLRETSHFVLIASTLLLIKSKSLLPILELTEEEEETIEDLEHRLRLYQLYRDASTTIRTRFGTRMLYERPYRPSHEPLFLPDSYTTQESLTNAIQTVLTNLPKKSAPRVNVSVKKIISLEEMIGRLEKRITQQFRMRFKDLAGTRAERPEVIVSFLAVLELVKQGMIMVRQERQFADFDIEREGVDTPRYT